MCISFVSSRVSSKDSVKRRPMISSTFLKAHLKDGSFLPLCKKMENHYVVMLIEIALLCAFIAL